MPISVVCYCCRSRLNAPDRAAGRILSCPRCNSEIPVPNPQAPPGQVGKATSEMEIDEPIRRRKHPSSGKGAAVVVLAAILGVSGGVCIFYLLRIEDNG